MDPASTNLFPGQTDVSLDLLVPAVKALALGQALPVSAASAAADRNPAIALRLGLKHDNPAEPDSPGANGWYLHRQPRWQLQTMRANDQHVAAWHGLFKACFGYDLPEATRQWKYPEPGVIGIGVWRGDDLVAFYGGMPRAISFMGQPSMGVQIGDVMVHPSQRGAFTRQGPFQMAASTYLEEFIGHQKPYLLGFGFPEDNALRLGEHLGLYAKVDSMVELRWPSLDKCQFSWGCVASVLAPGKVPVYAAALDTLWKRMQKSFNNQAIIGVRDWAYINHRYLLHPLRCYTMLLVRRRLGGRVLGLAVLRDRAGQGLELVDLLAPVSQFARVVDICRRFAGGTGSAGLFCWITSSHAHCLANSASQQSPLNLAVPTAIWSNGPSADVSRDRWWLMAGDTDFR